jgi:hypothetical protein
MTGASDVEPIGGEQVPMLGEGWPAHLDNRFLEEWAGLRRLDLGVLRHPIEQEAAAVVPFRLRPGSRRARTAALRVVHGDSPDQPLNRRDTC